MTSNARAPLPMPSSFLSGMTGMKGLSVLQNKVALSSNDKDGWVEHTSKDGRKYYYHAKLGKSQWEKPDELKTKEEMELSLQTAWKEYTATDGRTYWYNKITKSSVWNMPEEIRKLKAELESEAKWPVFDNKDDAREHFKLLMEAKKLQPRVTWENALKALEADYRWPTLAILTKGEKKQLFSEFISQAQKKSQEEERRRRQKARELIVESLSNWESLSLRTKYIDFAENFHTAEWWSWIDENERDEIFQDFMDDYEKRMHEKKRKHRKEIIENLVELFKKLDGCHSLLKWKDVLNKIKDNPDFNKFDKLEQLQAWMQFHSTLEKKEREQAKKEIYRSERKRRWAMKELLHDLISKGEMHAKSEWTDIMKLIETESRYVDMVGQGGSTPREIFEMLKSELYDDFSHQKGIIKMCVKNSGLELTEGTTFEQFQDILRENEEMNQVSVINARLCFDKIMRELKKAKKFHPKKLKKLCSILSKIEIENEQTNAILDEILQSSMKHMFLELCPTLEIQQSAIAQWKAFMSSEAEVHSTAERENHSRSHKRDHSPTSECSSRSSSISSESSMKHVYNKKHKKRGHRSLSSERMKGSGSLASRSKDRHGRSSRNKTSKRKKLQKSDSEDDVSHAHKYRRSRRSRRSVSSSGSR